MLASDTPDKFAIPFADQADPSYSRQIPQESQVNIHPGWASLETGFPPLNFNPIAAGGIPPRGADFNGILKQITQWSRWYSAGGAIKWDAAFASAVAGYPAGAVVMSNVVLGNLFMSIVDGNTTDPDSMFSANWIVAPGTFGTGDWIWRPSGDTRPSWIKANGTTIGSAASSATQYAAADAYPLYAFHWNRYSNVQCPVLPGGRGANPAADFAANKTIQVLDMRGLSPIGMDTMGGSPSTFLSGIPIAIGNATTPASIVGENLHVLLLAELAAHTHANSLSDPGHAHGVSDPGHAHSVSGGFIGGTNVGGFDGGGVNVAFGPQGIVINAAATGIGISSAFTGLSINNASAGSNAPHNTVHRSMTGTHYIHL